MQLRRNRSTTDAPRSIWGALGLNADTAPEITDSRLSRLAEVAGIWPFVLFAQILAPASVAVVVNHLGHSELLGDVAIRGGLILLMSLGALVQFKLPRARQWPTQTQVRTLTLSAAGIGAGLLSLLPLLAGPDLLNSTWPGSSRCSPRSRSPRSQSTRCAPRRSVTPLRSARW